MTKVKVNAINTEHKVLTICIPNKPPHDKTNKMICAPSKDSDQPGHPPSLISLCCLPGESLGPKLPIKRTDWAYAQADLSLRWAHMSLCWFCHEAAQILTLYL